MLVSGNVTARQSYYPYGGVRQQVGTLPTRRTYTGQYDDDTGLMFYNARYYAPALGRFISADTVVPGAGSQALNRYMYTLGNPLKFTDPSGHCAEADPDYSRCSELQENIRLNFGIRADDNIDLSLYWNIQALQWLEQSLQMFRDAIGQHAWGMYLHSQSFVILNNLGNTGSNQNLGFTKPGGIEIDPRALNSKGLFQSTVVHEFVHLLIDRRGTQEKIVRNFVKVAWHGKNENPGDGPTDYARTADSRLGLDPREEDLAETFTVLVVPGTAQYPITAGRARWFYGFLNSMPGRAFGLPSTLRKK